MRCLWCFRTKHAGQRPKSKRNDRKANSQDTPANTQSMPLPTRYTNTPQPMSQPDLQTPPQSPRRSSSESLSSGSSTSVVRAVPLDDPFNGPRVSAPLSRPNSGSGSQIYPLRIRSKSPESPTPASRQYRRMNDSYDLINSLRSHERRMARTQQRNYGPQKRDNSPTLLGNWSSTGMTFNERMARLSTHTTITQVRSAQQHTWLNDRSNASSDSDDEHRVYSHDDSGYVSTRTTPVKPNNQHIIEATNPTVRSDLVPAPLFFNRSSSTPPAITNATQEAQSRNLESLCDHRLCLRHEGTCLEHTPTPSPRTRASRIPAPQQQDRRLGRRARGGEVRRSELDVWMQIAQEYQSGS